VQGFAECNKIGAGGFGEVYRGVLHATDVAIKRVQKEVVDHLQVEKLFWSEVNTLSHARHANIISLLGCCPEQHLLVYEYHEGGNLQQRIGWGNDSAAGRVGARQLTPNSAMPPQQPPLTWVQRLQVVLQVASGLDYLHGQGILHM
jgi:serine/threonine protein kinase